MQSDEIRTKFIDYFKQQGHDHLPSGPLVPQSDPTLMFTNSGMVQFKNIFTGQEPAPENPNVVTVQKCLRAGGKHNDLAQVGYTPRHHSMFEMLGNFSFGDYFKPEAIQYAWEFVTGELGLPEDRLHVTVHADDAESYGLWQQHVPADRIIKINSDDNFWSMGDTGPCGYCSEIFYDHGGHLEGGRPGAPDEDGDRYVEIWNLVFMQYECTAKGQPVSEMRELPMKCIDTGMGLERIAAVMQETHNNYETDLFEPIVGDIEGLTERTRSPSHRVIADHLRAVSFMISEGIEPSSEGRGYVLRRIMRRAMRHVHLLGYAGNLLGELLGPFALYTEDFYKQDIAAKKDMIGKVIEQEVDGFRHTLERGMKVLDEKAGQLADGGVLPGADAFLLYDTYGFPLDMTEDILKDRGIRVDADDFRERMRVQQAQSKPQDNAWALYRNNPLWQKIVDEYGATDFRGCSYSEAGCRVLGILKDGRPVQSLAENETGLAVFNRTPFYGESGGQVGDTGRMADGVWLTAGEIRNAYKTAAGLVVHDVRAAQGELKVGTYCELSHLDEKRRRDISANHSATHLLHYALRSVLGDHVQQKGSKVSDKELRFDFSHAKPVTADEIAEIESEVNRLVREGIDVEIREMPLAEAKQLGAMALFGEKYGDAVRVVQMGPSIELCGGTHAANTAQIGAFKIVKESSVSAGVRRIKALTGDAAAQYADAAAGESKRKKPDVPVLILDEIPAETINGISVKLRRLPQAVGMNDMKGVADQDKEAVGSGVVAVACANDKGKTMLVVGVTADLTEQYSARDLFAATGMRGGGRPDLAQGGGEVGIDEAFGALRAAVEK